MMIKTPNSIDAVSAAATAPVAVAQRLTEGHPCHLGEVVEQHGGVCRRRAFPHPIPRRRQLGLERDRSPGRGEKHGDGDRPIRPKVVELRAAGREALVPCRDGEERFR